MNTKAGPSRTQPEAVWKTATRDTIRRIRHVLDLDPDLTEDRAARERLIEQARLHTDTMRISADRYWPVYVNTLRILVATSSPNEVGSEELFD